MALSIDVLQADGLCALICAEIEEPSDRLIDVMIAWQWSECSTDDLIAVFHDEGIDDFEVIDRAIEAVLSFMDQPIRGASEFDSEV